MKLEHHLFKTFSYKIEITHTQLNASTSTASDPWRAEMALYDVFAQDVGMLLLITASKTNC